MTSNYRDEGTLLIRNSDIKDGRFEFSDSVIYLDKDFANQNQNRMHQIGDVVTVHTGDVGTSAVISEKENKSLGFATIVTRPNLKLVMSDYLCMFLNTDKHKKWAVSVSTGDGRTNYNLGDYFELIVPITTIEEQKKIALFMKKISNLITLHQRKYDKLVNIKKAMLEKMFPKDGAKVPEIRFKGFTNDWEQRKADSIGYYTKGNGYSKADLTSEGMPIILYGRLYTDYSFYIDSIDTFVGEIKGCVYSEGGEVIIPASGETAEDIARASAVLLKGVLLGGDLNILNLNSEYDSKFIALLLSNGYAKKELSKCAQGKSVVHIHNADIRKLLLMIPIREEQRKIAELFTSLDRLITLHQRKLEKLQNLKQACLAKLFV